MKKYDRLSEELLIKIQSLIPQCKTASELAKEINFDVSGIIKHIKTKRILKPSTGVNKCGNKFYCCHEQDVCNKCFYKKPDPKKRECKSCKRNCNQVCKGFTKIPQCPRLKKYPYVCNCCPDFSKCRQNKYLYEAAEIWKAIKGTRSNSRAGVRRGEGEFQRLSSLLAPLILGKKQSLPQIFLTHKEEIGCSYVTILKYIDLGLIPGIKNMDLTKRVVYPKSYKKVRDEPTNAAFLAGRTHDDFVGFIAENRDVDVVEMDTVLSSRGGSKCVLTLLFRKSNFMLGFLLEAKTSAEVAKVFRMIKEKITPETFSSAFRCILTDNGTEFANPLEIEIDADTGERLCHVFYCDPGKSGQKGKIEKNHVELRKVFPKPTSFDGFTQKDLNIALSHINSEPRAILNKNCPGRIAPIWLNEKILALNEYQFICPDDVHLSPELLK